jgi:hypothetical protein
MVGCSDLPDFFEPLQPEEAASRALSGKVSPIGNRRPLLTPKPTLERLFSSFYEVPQMGEPVNPWVGNGRPGLIAELP